MASSVQHIQMSEDAYFQMLEKSLHKYEYWNGVAVAMAGAQPDHVRIETNIVGELFQKLRGKSCLPLVSNQAVKIGSGQRLRFSRRNGCVRQAGVRYQTRNRMPAQSHGCRRGSVAHHRGDGRNR